METLAFYSYKGGVGRSLLLANTARYLATLGRRVVALDLDFEAPGLHYKLPAVVGRPTARKRSVFPLKGGAVPYLLATADGSASPPPLEKHVVQVPVPPGSKGWLRLMPAGPAPHRPYWTALKDLGERLRLDDASGHGVLALLDLQARIEEELKPHYLLIDARTGVTELGGLATTVLADTVICLFVANQESIDGTLTVADALKNAPRLKGQEPIRIVPVLSRTTGPPSDQRLIAGISRLLEVGEGRPDAAKRAPKVFVLPHDETIAAERVVGGTREASAFSPLYKSYLELYQHLFPANAEAAREALQRLEVIASIKEELTKERRGGIYGFGPYLTPWSGSAIEEGVEVESERYGEPKRRYADLVCRDATGRVVLVVEYVLESAAQAKDFWQEKADVRCVVLVSPGESGTTRKILSRASPEQELQESNLLVVPLPKEFEVFRDVGDRSIEAMLEAFRRGHQEAAAWLVEDWQISVAALSGMPPHAWRPARAKRILDGLAATEDAVCGEAVLRLATLGDPHPMRRERQSREGWWSGDEYDRWMETELLALLFWRLPVEAVLGYQEPRDNRGEVPSQAGYRLLAQDLMGLTYEPVRIALTEAETYGRRFPTSASSTEEADVTLRWVPRGWWCTVKQLQITESLPAVMVWDELFSEKPYWRGSLDDALRELGPEKLKTLGSPSGLRSRLRGLVVRRELVTEGLLGDRDGDRRITLNGPAVVAAADLMGLSPRYVKSVVFIHLAALALAYDARDLDGGPGYGFAPSLSASPPAPLSPVNVGLAQAFTHRLILRLGDSNLLAAFEKLSDHQAEPYRQWRTLRRMPLEGLRVLLLRARGNPTMVGMPRPETDGD